MPEIGDIVPANRISSYTRGIYNKVVKTFKENNLTKLEAVIIYQGKKNKQCVAISGTFEYEQNDKVVKLLKGFTHDNQPGDMAWVISNKSEVYWWI